jgi:hypothetical protein
MKIKRNGKRLFCSALCGIAILGAAQIYFVRELFFAWLMFIFGFCVIAVSFFLLIALFEAARATLDWVVPQISAPRPAGSARLVRSH